MVVEVASVIAKKESSVLDLGVREPVGITVYAGSRSSLSHQGIPMK
jgi:hypothetical protein